MDLRFRRRYLAWGDYKPLMSALSFKQGWKGKLESAWLYIQQILPGQYDASLVKTSLQRSFSEDITDAFLFDTSWYKQTDLVGVVNSSGKRNFIKIYKNCNEALLEIASFKFVMDHFSGAFVLISQAELRNNVISMPLLKKARNVSPADHIEERLIQLSRGLLNESGIRRNINDMIPLGFLGLLSQCGFQVLAERIISWISRHDHSLHLIPIHGDMTPWNMFVQHDERIVLTDYERVGWHIPLYDLFHFCLQPEAMKPKAESFYRILKKKPWYVPQIDEGAVLYLADQLYQDLSDKIINGYDHRNLMRAINNKLFWLNEVLSNAR